MKITLSPQLRNDILVLSKAGEVLTFNEQVVDLSAIPEGEIFPEDENNPGVILGCQWITKLARVDGDIEITVVLPLAADHSPDAAYPDPIIDPAAGIIELPQ